MSAKDGGPDVAMVTLTRTELRLLSEELQAAAIAGSEIVLRAMCIEASSRLRAMLAARGAA